MFASAYTCTPVVQNDKWEMKNDKWKLKTIINDKIKIKNTYWNKIRMVKEFLYQIDWNKSFILVKNESKPYFHKTLILCRKKIKKEIKKANIKERNSYLITATKLDGDKMRFEKRVFSF